MKSSSILVGLVALVLATAAGCNKQEPAPPPVSETPKPAAPAPDVKPAPSVAADVKKADDTAQQQAAAAQQAADKAAADAQAQAAAQAAAAKQASDKAAADAQAQAMSISSKAQSMIDTATKQIANKNWSDALKTLTDLSALKLTPEQQAMVDNLKHQAEKLAQDAAATKALGGLLEKK